MNIAALAIQGDYGSHIEAALRAFPGSSAIELRAPKDFPKEAPDIFLIPGGESSSFSYLIEYNNLRPSIEGLIKAPGTVTLATCAGAILLASEIINPGRAVNIPILDMSIERNAYGRQADSFIGKLELSEAARELGIDPSSIAPEALEAVFIRAPIIRRLGPDVQVLATVGGIPVLARQGRVIVATFHPEQSKRSVVYELLRAGTNSGKH